VTTVVDVAMLPAGVEVREIDLSPVGDFFDDRDWDDPSQVAQGIEAAVGDRQRVWGYLPHLSASMVGTRRRQPGSAQPATIRLGATLLAAPGAELRAPFAGEVLQPEPLVVRHQTQESGTVWTCWWGLETRASQGSSIAPGDVLGVVAASDDAALGASVRVVTLRDAELTRSLPPAVAADDIESWSAHVMDPASLLGLPTTSVRDQRLDGPSVIRLRDQRLARSQRAYYRRPPHFVRGRGVWLYDEHGRGYLDSLNNVTHVGHADPRITEAASRQLKKLNTNSRFIYEGIAAYAERLVSSLPDPLEVVFLVCTGSEANDLALRIARQVTGRSDVIVIDGAYHGNTAAVMGVSPNRYKGPGGRGSPPTTHEAMQPDVYRGPYGRNDEQAGPRYAAHVAAHAQRLASEGRPPAAFIAESLMGTAGNVVFPAGYLATAFDAVRAAGGVCISDEVQVGVGRLGSHFWGFQAQGVVPDIVTMGKPLGNGHPIAAVVTTREIADAFDDGVKYFNTFGGNPVSCAIGSTVMDIVEQDGLQARAGSVGDYFLRSLQELMGRHDIVGNVRGHGLYLGVELVRNRETKEPAAAEAMAVSEAMKDHGVVSYPTGVHDNVLKIKPPMVFGNGHVDIYTEVLDHVLAAEASGGCAC